MEVIPKPASKTELSKERLPRSNRDVELKWLDRFAHVLDNLFRLPGTHFRFGIDPILGLIPLAGTIVSLIISLTLLVYIIRYGASGRVIVKMLGNTLLDFAVGSIPIIGTLFDFVYKANERNMRLMKEHYHEEKHLGSAWPAILMVVAIGLTVVVGSAILFASILTAIYLYFAS